MPGEFRWGTSKPMQYTLVITTTENRMIRVPVTFTDKHTGEPIPCEAVFDDEGSEMEAMRLYSFIMSKTPGGEEEL